jgi:hypothetical protein
MKKFIILLFLSILSASEIDDIIEMIHILKKRSLKYIRISNMYDPFNPQIKTKTGVKLIIPKNSPKVENKTKNSFDLEIVFQDKVKISGQWYKIGQMIGKYKIVKERGEILLKNGNRLISLKRKIGLRIR